MKALLVFPFPYLKYRIFWYYRLFSNGAVLIGILIAVYNLPSFNDRLILLTQYNFGIFMYVIAFLGNIMACFCIYFDFFEFESNEFNEDRSLENLLETKAFVDIKECLEYGIISWSSQTHVNQIFFFACFICQSTFFFLFFQ